MPLHLHPDALIFGGGVAGLWLLDELVRHHYQPLLLESFALGSGQTAASQGIIHGGLKYTLTGLFTDSAKSIREMPALWRSCLAGQSQPDLSKVRKRADFCYLWRTDSLSSKLAMVGARTGLRVKPVELPLTERPPALAGASGSVYRLDEQVIDPISLIATLAAPHKNRILLANDQMNLQFESSNAGIRQIILTHNDTTLIIEPKTTIFTAGAGNESLRQHAQLPPAQQRRPLHMVLLRGNLPTLNGHCVDANSTRVTITTDHDSAGRIIWQIGGQVAEQGVNMTPDQLITHTRNELRAVLPLELPGVDWSTYRADRAESNSAGKRPESFTILTNKNVITAWPTKLALAPQLAQQIRDQLPPPSAPPLPTDKIAHWPKPTVARPPWESAQWKTLP